MFIPGDRYESIRLSAREDERARIIAKIRERAAELREPGRPDPRMIFGVLDVSTTVACVVDGLADELEREGRQR